MIINIEQTMLDSKVQQLLALSYQEIKQLGLNCITESTSLEKILIIDAAISKNIEQISEKNLHIFSLPLEKIFYLGCDELGLKDWIELEKTTESLQWLKGEALWELTDKDEMVVRHKQAFSQSVDIIDRIYSFGSPETGKIILLNNELNEANEVLSNEWVLSKSIVDASMWLSSFPVTNELVYQANPDAVVQSKAKFLHSVKLLLSGNSQIQSHINETIPVHGITVMQVGPETILALCRPTPKLILAVDLTEFSHEFKSLFEAGIPIEYTRNMVRDIQVLDFKNHAENVVPALELLMLLLEMYAEAFIPKLHTRTICNNGMSIQNLNVSYWNALKARLIESTTNNLDDNEALLVNVHTLLPATTQTSNYTPRTATILQSIINCNTIERILTSDGVSIEPFTVVYTEKGPDGEISIRLPYLQIEAGKEKTKFLKLSLTKLLKDAGEMPFVLLSEALRATYLEFHKVSGVSGNANTQNFSQFVSYVYFQHDQRMAALRDEYDAATFDRAIQRFYKQHPHSHLFLNVQLRKHPDWALLEAMLQIEAEIGAGAHDDELKHALEMASKHDLQPLALVKRLTDRASILVCPPVRRNDQFTPTEWYSTYTMAGEPVGEMTLVERDFLPIYQWDNEQIIKTHAYFEGVEDKNKVTEFLVAGPTKSRLNEIRAMQVDDQLFMQLFRQYEFLIEKDFFSHRENSGRAKISFFVPSKLQISDSGSYLISGIFVDEIESVLRILADTESKKNLLNKLNLDRIFHSGYHQLYSQTLENKDFGKLFKVKTIPFGRQWFTLDKTQFMFLNDGEYFVE